MGERTMYVISSALSQQQRGWGGGSCLMIDPLPVIERGRPAIPCPPHYIYTTRTFAGMSASLGMLSFSASKARTPMRPAKRASHVALVPTPKGLTIPIPVTTTRRRAAAMLGGVRLCLCEVRVGMGVRG